MARRGAYRRVPQLTHYRIGIADAGLLVVVQGTAWLEQPTYLPALAVGVTRWLLPGS